MSLLPILSTLPPSDSADRLVVTGVVGLAALAVGSLRVAPNRHWLVITRRGQVRRVVTTGLALRIPGLDACRLLPRDAQHLPIGVSALTRDGVQVQLLVTAVLRVADPVVAGSLADPIGTTLAEVRDLLRRLLADHDVEDVLRVRTTIERSAWEAGHGVEIEGVLVDAIDLELVHAKYRSQT
ncbi:SPFH domain-containing protein [Kribbella italica]|uniref:Regulator of protease activity HflC (Stomatin/prohibitin superfamily) n=1 Tax=Kribbella italica TaxID=1540520 RepID=A0A7W9J5D0_9ACTN|nr:SPFH domain-containing protein [Kribbella italica]MBB5835927.1 regulator of protease activity HflC (stomatin/prohibitin superfamily) [Kribbella italica]